MKDEKKFVIDTLKTVYGVTDTAEMDFLSDEDPEQVDDSKLQAIFIDLDKKKIQGIKTKTFNEGAQSREKKLKTDIETALKTKFGITETDFTGDDLDTLIDHIAETRKPGKGALTEEELLKHPSVVRLRNQHQTELQNKETEFNQKLTAKEQEEAKKTLRAKVASGAIALLKSKNPILPDDEAKATRRINKDLIEELNAYDVMEVDGKPIPLDKDGKQLENANGVLLTFDDLIEGIINDNFEFAAASERRAPANGKVDPLKGKPQQQQPEKEAYTGKIPDTNEEYLKLISPQSGLSVAERSSLVRQYKKKKGH